MAKLTNEVMEAKRSAIAAATRTDKALEPDKEIKNALVLELLGAAKAKLAADAAVDRAEVALEVQEGLMALRELGAGFSGHGVTLHPSKDMFIMAAGAHPRGVVLALLEKTESKDGPGVDVFDTVTLVELRDAVLAALTKAAGR